ncbi:MAG: choice-of-anchor J domain-containing protein, partial [Cyclobacteriaceae bacterium]|nr:choice-of-anchor J domain-containing protein [Cyclobacteriaceae bacterium]
MRVCFLFLVSMGLLPLSTFAQGRCGTVEYERKLERQNSKRSLENFERWVGDQINKNAKNSNRAEQTQTTLTIPVVIHIIHNGEPIGTGLNISDAQIASQMTVLNNDFNRLNADQINTPSLFQPVAGSFDVQFVLAKQDPNGIATNGIVRVQGSKTSWTSTNDDFLLKSQSYWPAEQYLNIWVTSLTDYLGYAQFPVTSLPPFDFFDERLTDGIIVNYRHFGSIDGGTFDLSSRYNKGRTLTHEMGHFFGLRHIWGDVSSCSTSTDYVDDTPVQNSSTSGCPAHPQTSCSNTKMFQNYLDYSDDACMNIFTQGQVARMSFVAANSPRRKELLNSIGSLPPTAVANDLGIKTILSPTRTACSGSMMPSITVRNFGTNLISSAQLQLKRNNSVIETKNILLTLAVGAEQSIDFLPVLLSTESVTQFEFIITFTNNILDGKSANNSKTIVTTTPSIATLPISESFTSFPLGWSVTNPDNSITWQLTNTGGKSSVFLKYNDYTKKSAVDKLITPLIDLTTQTNAYLIFERAYAQYPERVGERLRVLASDMCRFDVATTTIFDKSDEVLATSSSTLCAFVPGAADWVTEVIPLSSFIGKSIQLAFEGTNGNGNNFYLSNVRIVTNAVTDLKLVKLESPSPVTCSIYSSIKLRIRNIGTTTINSFTCSISLGSGGTSFQSFSGLALAPNAETVIEVTQPQLVVGVNQLTVNIFSPNGIADQNTLDNSNIYQVIINNTRETIPLRERFDSNSLQKWTIVSQQPQPTWRTASTNYLQSLVYNSFTNTTIGAESWLVSPILDLTNNTEASVFFDASYAKRINGCEQLRVLASTDCGATYTDILLDQIGSQLAVTDSEDSWKPVLSSDWKNNFISLQNYVGQAN